VGDDDRGGRVEDGPAEDLAGMHLDAGQVSDGDQSALDEVMANVDPVVETLFSEA